jgi:c-di-GMP-specific phosphodiesterase
VETDDRARSFIAAVIRLGHDLGLEVVVEGIESHGQLMVVRDLGASYVQGYFIDPPRAAEYINLQRDWSSVLVPRSGILPRPRQSVDGQVKSASR